jgi:hypothetical protein
MVDLDIIALLNLAHAARAEAERARRLAAQQSDDATRFIIKRFARQMAAKATELEKLSLSIVPARFKARAKDDAPV